MRSAAEGGAIEVSLVDSAREQAEELGSNMESASSSRQASLKKKCLRRNGYKCAITGYIDGALYLNTTSPEEPQNTIRSRQTHLSHIIHVCIGSFQESEVCFSYDCYYSPNV